ncbi:MAG: aminotransferase class III-fold pyridoxal phosphate-dependent enzyme [Candidatus Margulisiibacteriota bacterium]
MMPKKSQKIFEEAKRYLVGGVNSPLRAFGAVGGNPLVIKEGKGARVKDIEGREYIDYVGNFGALILGHAHPKVVAAVKKALAAGSSFGTTTQAEVELGKEICAAFPSIDRLRLTNSGTEAVMGALKLAKAFTKRNKIIKFKECYHGWSEQPYLEAEYNNLESVRCLVSKDVAAIIVEPVAGNFGVIPPAAGFLEGLRKICDQNGALLIFDEVITGFRVAYGGAQELYRVRADLTCLGKVIGGGFPVGAFGGKKEIMKLLAPEGPVYQAGTFSGNPITMAAGLETLRILKNNKIYKDLDEKTKVLCEGLNFKGNRVGSMFSFVIDDYPAFFWKMLKKGFYFSPSEKEANFVSMAHSWKDIAATIKAVRS